MTSYNPIETEKLIKLYTEASKDPNFDSLKTVDKLCVKFNRTRKSIIAKLSKEGVYHPKIYRDKTGDTPVTKLELVYELEDMLDDKFEGLDKTPKSTLKKLTQSVRDLTTYFDDALGELAELRENQRIAGDMKKVKEYDELEVLADGNY